MEDKQRKKQMFEFFKWYTRVDGEKVLIDYAKTFNYINFYCREYAIKVISFQMNDDGVTLLLE